MWNETITSALPPARRATRTPSGSSPSVSLSNPSGAPSTATRWPGLMPSFFGSGVPLYVVKLFGRALVTATNATSDGAH